MLWTRSAVSGSVASGLIVLLVVGLAVLATVARVAEAAESSTDLFADDAEVADEDDDVEIVEAPPRVGRDHDDDDADDDGGTHTHDGDDDDDASIEIEDADQEKPQPKKQAPRSARIRTPFRPQDYPFEMFMAAIAACYILNFAMARGETTKKALAWLTVNNGVLGNNFSSVTVGENKRIQKDTDSEFTVYATGRQHFDYLAIKLQFHQQQDLYSRFEQTMFPTREQVHYVVAVPLMQSVTALICERPRAAKLIPQFSNLTHYATALNTDFLKLPSHLGAYGESAEAVQWMLNGPLGELVRRSGSTKSERTVSMIHVSDAMSAYPEGLDDAEKNVKPEETVKRIVISFYLPKKQSAMVATENYSLLVMNFAERLAREQMPFSAREKVQKKRQAKEREWEKERLKVVSATKQRERELEEARKREEIQGRIWRGEMGKDEIRRYEAEQERIAEKKRQHKMRQTAKMKVKQ